MIKRFTLILSVVICAVSCADELHDGVSPSLQDGTVMTKVVNTPADSQEGVLLLCLQEAAADAFASGDETLADGWCHACQVIRSTFCNQGGQGGSGKKV